MRLAKHVVVTRQRKLLSLGIVVVVVAAAIIVGVSKIPRNAIRVYHVATAGSDAYDGSAQNPWRTIQKATDTAEPNSVILVDSGTFEPFKVSRPGLTITGAPGQAVTIQGQENVRDVAWLGADDTTLSNITIEGCTPRINQGISFAEDSSGVRAAEGTRGVTISRVTVRDSHGTNAEGLPVGCYGIIINGATDAVVEESELYHNGFGVAVVGGQNTRITNNRIYANDVIIRNGRSNDDDDFGGVGIGFINVTEGALADGNNLYGNQGSSTDYGTDGGAFEIYESSNITIRRNIMTSNDAILETGTAPGGDCFDNVFEENIAWGRTGDNPRRHTTGILLRCAHEMSITRNYLSSADSWMFQITANDKFSGSLSGLTIAENTIRQDQDLIYQLDLDPAGLSIDINANTYETPSAFALDWKNERVDTLAEWQRLTGLDTRSTCECASQ